MDRKTFATLKIYQGVPRSQVMMATGHQTEANFNRYLGIDEKEFMEVYRRTARKVMAKRGLLGFAKSAFTVVLKQFRVGGAKKKAAPPGKNIIAFLSF